VVFTSLVVDAILVFFARGNVSEEYAERVTIISALIIVSFLDQRRVSTTMSRLRNFHKVQQSKRSQSSHTAFIMTLLAVLAGKFILLPSVTNIIGLIFTAVVITGIIVNMKRAWNDRKLHVEALSKSPWIQISLWERQLVVISTIPILAARLISLFGTLTIQNAQTTALSIGCFVLSALLLLCLKPERAAFVGLCTACKSPAPIVFVQYGKCPACDCDLAAQLQGVTMPASGETRLEPPAGVKKPQGK
jgi:hypothetical protein